MKMSTTSMPFGPKPGSVAVPSMMNELLVDTSSLTAGLMIVNTGAAPATGAAGLGAAAPPPEPPPFTLTCLNHQPLPGVCTYTDNVCGPPGTWAPLAIAATPELV